MRSRVAAPSLRRFGASSTEAFKSEELAGLPLGKEEAFFLVDEGFFSCCEALFGAGEAFTGFVRSSGSSSFFGIRKAVSRGSEIGKADVSESRTPYASISRALQTTWPLALSM